MTRCEEEAARITRTVAWGRDKREHGQKYGSNLRLSSVKLDGGTNRSQVSADLRSSGSSVQPDNILLVDDHLAAILTSNLQSA